MLLPAQPRRHMRGHELFDVVKPRPHPRVAGLGQPVLLYFRRPLVRVVVAEIVEAGDEETRRRVLRVRAVKAHRPHLLDALQRRQMDMEKLRRALLVLLVQIVRRDEQDAPRAFDQRQRDARDGFAEPLLPAANRAVENREPGNVFELEVGEF